jgi:PleD family two-component response regulator
MSDDTDDSIADKAFECGANDYISKPIKNELLLRRVKSHLTIKSRKTREKFLEVLLKEEKSQGNFLNLKKKV